MKFYIVDVFAEEKYQGNQLAVFIPDYDITQEEMQKIAREMNFSETTFILSDKKENGGYDVKVFTPDVEVPFAGHPTIGTAYVIHKIIEEGKSKSVILNLKVGPIKVTIDEKGLTMEQNQPKFGEILGKDLIAEFLQISPEDIRDDYPIQWASTGLECIVIPLKTIDALKRCHVNHTLFQKFIDNYYKCNQLVFVQDGDNHLKVRVFMDDPGFLEDPATGSANGNLAGYLLKYNFFGSNDISYTVSQGAECGRPSALVVNASLIDNTYKIHVGGKAYLVSKGEWL